VFALRRAAAVPLSRHAHRESETETRVQCAVYALALRSATNPRSSTSNATCVRTRSSVIAGRLIAMAARSEARKVAGLYEPAFEGVNAAPRAFHRWSPDIG